MIGLCFRCEYRAQFLEQKRQPRCQCGDVNKQVISCYMYKPVRPIITMPDEPFDDRIRFGPAMIASREIGFEVAEDFELNIKIDGKKAVLYWSPKDEKDVEDKG